MPSESPSRPGPSPNPSGTDAPRPSQRSTASPWRTALIVGAVVVVGLALALARPVYRQVERWRADTLISQGSELARQQLFSEAIARYQTALSLNPNQADALRGLADIYSTFEKPAALPAWRALLQHPQHTEQDILNFIGFTLRIQRFDLAEAQLSQLLAHTNISTPVRLVAADFFQRQGDPARALAFAEDALRLEPDNRSHQFRVARSLIALAQSERQREGLQRLHALAPFSPQERLALFQTLLEAPSLPIPDTAAFLDTLPALPGTPANDLLAQTEIRLRLHPEATTRDQTLRPVIQTLRTSSPEDQLQLARWLLRLREPARVLDLYSLADATALPAVLPAYLDALGQAEHWNDLLTATSATLPIDPWIQDAFRASAASRLRQEALAQEHWRRAFERAQGEPTRIQAVGDIALRLGVTEKAIQAFNLLANHDLFRTTGYRRLARVYEALHDSERLRLLMREWCLNDPEDPVPNAAYAYLCALLRRDLDDARTRIVRLTETFPTRATYRATLAFLDLRRNQPQAALQLLQRTRPDAAIPAQVQLIRALVLEANGQSAAAKDLVRNLPTNDLLPEEQALISKLTAR